MPSLTRNQLHLYLTEKNKEWGIGLERWTVSDKDILNLGQQNYELVTNCNLLWYQQEQIHFSVSFRA